MSSERRGAELLLLDSIRPFQSMLLKVMVAVRWRWLQRMANRGSPGVRQECMHSSADLSTKSWLEPDKSRLGKLLK